MVGNRWETVRSLFPLLTSFNQRDERHMDKNAKCSITLISQIPLANFLYAVIAFTAVSLGEKKHFLMERTVALVVFKLKELKHSGS